MESAESFLLKNNINKIIRFSRRPRRQAARKINIFNYTKFPLAFLCLTGAFIILGDQSFEL